MKIIIIACLICFISVMGIGATKENTKKTLKKVEYKKIIKQRMKLGMLFLKGMNNLAEVIEFVLIK